MGVRDDVSKVLGNIMAQAEDIQELMGKLSIPMSAINNAAELERALNQIAVAKERISEAKGLTTDKNTQQQLRDMEKSLSKIEKRFENFSKMKGGNMELMGVKGMAKFMEEQENLSLALNQVRRVTGEISAQAKQDERDKIAEANRIDTLKEKYYELYRIRKELQDAILSATPGTDITDATSMLQSVTARIGAVRRAMANGSGLPQSVVGADSEEFFRDVKAKTRELTSATNEYNRTLDTTQAIQANLKRLELDTESQKKIAGIRHQTTEYVALEKKLRDIIALEAEVKQDKSDYEAGRKDKMDFTREAVTARLDAINREYNETLAQGKRSEQDAADAKNRNANAARKAAEAIQMLSHVNQGLISSYNRIAEAGSNANRISIQLQQQLAGYAGLYGIERIVKSIITIGSQFEVQHVALQNILGDITEANRLFGQLKVLAVESPKTFMELTSYVKQLSAYQIPSDELFETTKRLADMSVGLGVDMNRLILAYGQVRSAAVLRGQELRQFTEAGIPMVQALADKFTQMNGKLTTTADVFKLISQRAVPFSMVKDVLWEMTEQGGKFYNMQEEMANTLYGKWQKLQDAWQIMLGEFADSNNPSGWILKNIIELVVTLTQHLSSLSPLISTVFGIKSAKYLVDSYTNARDKRTGETAIKNMQLAKISEANRLERERVMFGKQLNAQEKQLIAYKNQLVSRDYALLAQSGALSTKKTEQLIQEGKINRMTMMRLALEQGITKEKIRQMSASELQNAVGLFPNRGNEPNGGMLGRAGKGLLGFLGGWWGAAFAAGGLIASIVNIYKEADESIRQAAEAMKDKAGQDANSLTGALNNVGGSSESVSKKIEYLEDALKEMGNEGRRIIEESRKTDNVGQRWDVLYEKAKAYKEVLDELSTDESKAILEKGLKDSGIDKVSASYRKLRAAEYGYQKNISDNKANFEQAISVIIQKHKELEKELAGKNLFEQLRVIANGEYASEMSKIIKQIAPSRVETIQEWNHQALRWENKTTTTPSATYNTWSLYTDVIKKSEALMNKIQEENIPKLGSAFRAEIIASHIKADEATGKYSEDAKEKMKAIATRFAESVKDATPDMRNKIEQSLLAPFKIYITPVVGKPIKTGLANTLDKWQQESGYQLWNDQEQESAKTDFLGFSKKNSQALVDARKTKTQLEGQVKKAAGEAKEAAQSQLDATNTIIKGYEASLKEGLWVFDESLTKGNHGGSKEDKLLKQAETQLDEVKKIYSEYKKYREVYGADKGQSMIEEIFGIDRKKSDKIIKDYKEVIRNIINSLPANTEQRKKFVLSGKQLLGDIDLDETKKKLEESLKELQEYISKQTSNWNLYKQLLEKTGDEEFAKNAFVDNRVWDDAARELEKKLLEKTGDATVDYTMTQAAAEKYYKDNKEAYELWKKIVELTTHNWTDALSKGADAYAQLLTVGEKIKKNEEEIARLRKEGADLPNNSVRIMALQKENDKLGWEQFQQGSDYVRFFGAVLTMANSEVEKTAKTIQQRLAVELSRGTITAHQYAKSMKEVNDQLDKSRSAIKGNVATFLQGGQPGIVTQRQEEMQAAAIRVEEAQKELDLLNKRDATGKKVDQEEICAANAKLEAARNQLDEAKAALEISSGHLSTLKQMSFVLNVIQGVMDGVAKACQSLSEMYDALGKKTLSDDFSDMADAMNAITSITSPISNMVQSATSGNVSGFISNAIAAPVQMIAGPITAFAKLHDKQYQREIDASKERQEETERLTKNLETVLSRTLGGVYALRSSDEDKNKLREYGRKGYIQGDTREKINKALETESYYDTKLAELMIQRDELTKQMNAEEDKKKTDHEAVENYKQQIKELDDQVKYFALDMAKELYDIDIKSWAKELSDAVVTAWNNGQDAVEAYKDKVKSMTKDLTSNILSQKVMEKALDNVHLDDLISELMVETSGQLTEGSAEKIADALFQAGEKSVDTITNILDTMEAKGYIQKGDGSSSTTSKVIQGGFTENETGLVLSYMNAMRADLSVQRLDVNAILQNVQLLASRSSFLTQAQERNLESIAANTLRNADAAEEIKEILNLARKDKSFGFYMN